MSVRMRERGVVDWWCGTLLALLEGQPFVVLSKDRQIDHNVKLVGLPEVVSNPSPEWSGEDWENDDPPPFGLRIHLSNFSKPVHISQSPLVVTNLEDSYQIRFRDGNNNTSVTISVDPKEIAPVLKERWRRARQRQNYRAGPDLRPVAQPDPGIESPRVITEPIPA